MYLIVDIVLFWIKSLQLFGLESLLSLINIFIHASSKARKDSPPSVVNKMPHLRKRHSWPPLHKKPHASYFQESIDEDPLAYFLSDPAEESEAFLNGVAAGIDDTPRSRSWSPRHRETLVSTIVPSSPTTKLKKWIQKMELRCLHRSPRPRPPGMQRPMPSPEPFKFSKIPLTNSPPVRGRRDFRVGSTHRATPNSKSKPRRPRAWRAPSGDIWPVAEEKEAESVGLGIEVT